MQMEDKVMCDEDGEPDLQYDAHTMEQLEDACAKKGPEYVIVESNDLCLQIDLDGAATINMTAYSFLENAAVIEHSPPLFTPSKSGGKHVYYRLNFRTAIEERVAYQIALGSDVKRELATLMRATVAQRPPMVMFETKENAEKVAEYLKR